jgi:hypothetical protein
LPKQVEDISTINIASGIRERSIEEELSFDHPAHFHEWCFNQKIANFHWEMYELLLDGHLNPYGNNGQLLFLAPRNHAKTTILESFFCWLIGRDNLILTQVISSTQAVAEKRLGKVSNIFQYSNRYRSLFGDLYRNDPEFTWNNSELEVFRDRDKVWSEGGVEERDPTMAAIGITSSVEGGRAHFQGYDDIVSRKNATSKVLRETVKQEFWTTFDPMLIPGGQQVFMGTRYHYDDLYAELITKFDIESRYPDLHVEIIDGDDEE